MAARGYPLGLIALALALALSALPAAGEEDAAAATTDPASDEASLALRLARPVAFLGTFFFAGYLGAMMWTGALSFFVVNGVVSGLPLWIALALWTPTLATAITVVMVVLTLVAWGRGFWSPWGRLHYSLVVLGAVVCAVLLARWHLLGLTF